MLVLSRKRRQVIVLRLEDGRTIEVHVNKLGEEKVSLAIQAPASIQIVRGELEPRDTAA